MAARTASAIRPRARPNQAPTIRPSPIVASAAAKNAETGTCAPAALSSASTPITTSTPKNVTRPSFDFSFGGLGGFGGLTGGGPGGVADEPAYGPCGANGGRYPPDGGPNCGGCGG